MQPNRGMARIISERSVSASRSVSFGVADGAFHTPNCVVRITSQKGTDNLIRVSVSECITSFRLTRHPMGCQGVIFLLRASSRNNTPFLILSIRFLIHDRPRVRPFSLQKLANWSGQYGQYSIVCPLGGSVAFRAEPGHKSGHPEYVAHGMWALTP